MTRGIENALLSHGGTEDIDIPYPALQRIVEDAPKTDCGDMISQLRMQNEALEEANKRVCDERDTYKSLCHQLESRLAGREFE